VSRLEGQVRRHEERVATQADAARDSPSEEDHAPV